MKSKAEKLAAAKKNAEAEKAKKKAVRDAKANSTVTTKPGAKGKSAIPQAKKKGK